MDEYEKHEIYLNRCGSECPYPDCDCGMLDGEICTLEEPWFDCDDFIAANGDEIQNAEQEIAEKEDEENEG